MLATLGSVFVKQPDKIGVGHLHYDSKNHHAMVSVDPVNLLKVCRKLGGGTLNAACIPKLEWPDPPYIDPSDMQICAARGRRVKVGYVWTLDNEHGHCIYQVRFDVGAVLNRYDRPFFHLHQPTPEESEEWANCNRATLE